MSLKMGWGMFLKNTPSSGVMILINHIWFAGRKHATRLEALLATSSLVVFLFQWGQYPYVGSYYLRYVLLILMVGAGFRVFRTVHSLPWYVKPGWRQGFLFGFFIIGSLVLDRKSVV